MENERKSMKENKRNGKSGSEINYWRLNQNIRSPDRRFWSQNIFPPKRSFDSKKRSSGPFFAYNIAKAINKQRRREDLEKPLTISECRVSCVNSHARADQGVRFSYYGTRYSIHTKNIVNKKVEKN